MTDLDAPAGTAIDQCLGLDAGESCAVVTDEGCRAVGAALYDAAAAVTEDVALLEYPVGDQHGAEPPAAVAAAMAAADAFLAPTTKSLSHTTARKDACGGGARGATLPGITETVFATGLDADYEGIADACERLHEQVAGAEQLRVTTDAGTDITFEPGDREWLLDTGVVHDAGEFSNLPAGEVFVSPETADGTYVVDGTMMPHGRLEEGQTLTFEVEDGRVTSISDDEIRAMVEDAAEAVGDAAYNLAELGIGTNLGVEELVGSVLLDEKAAGTVHIALGDDHSIGGDVEAPIHLDGIVRDPTVHADGTVVDLPS